MQNKTCRKYVTHFNTISKTGKKKDRQFSFQEKKERKKKGFLEKSKETIFSI